MARQMSIGFELNEVSPGVEWTNTSGAPNAPAIQSTVVRSGTYAGRITSLSSGTPKWFSHQFANSPSTAQWWHRMYFCFAAWPSAENRFIVINDASGLATPIVYFTIDNGGVLRLYDEDGQITGTSTLSLDTWYRIEDHVDLVAAGSDIVRGYVDGTEFAGSAARSLSAGVMQITYGLNLGSEANTAGDLYLDDYACNNPNTAFQNSLPGPGKIIHLKPNADGDNTAWTGGWAEVDEVSPNETDFIASGTLDAIEDMNLEATPADLDSGATVNVVQVGFRNNLSSATGTDPRAVLRIKASSGGTVEESSDIVLNTTAWRTHNDGVVLQYLLTLYDLPGASTTAWTKATLDTAQIGARCSLGDADNFQITTEWLLVDYVPSAAIEESISLARSAAVAGSSQGELGNALSLGRSAAVIDSGQIETDINLSLARNAAVTTVGAKTVEESVSLGKSDAITTADQLDAQAAIVLDKSQVVTPSDQVDVEGAIAQARSAAITSIEQLEVDTALALGRSASVSIAEEVEGGAVEESITLGRSAAAVASAQLEVSTAVSLARAQAQTQVENLIAENVLSLGRSGAVVSAEQIEAEDLTTLARSAAITAEGEIAGAPIEESITLRRIMRCAIPISAPVEESISLARSSAIAESSQVELLADLTLARAGAIAESDQVEAVGDISLARAMAESLADTLQAEAATVLARLMGSNLATQAEVGNVLSLPRLAGITAEYEIPGIEESISLGRNAGMDANAYLEVTYTLVMVILLAMGQTEEVIPAPPIVAGRVTLSEALVGALALSESLVQTASLSEAKIGDLTITDGDNG